MKTALLTGTFDPVTLGHLDIFRRTARTFQKVLIGVGRNPKKNCLFTEEERANLIRSQIKETNVEVFIMGNRLTADIAYEQNACLVKGVRLGAADFDYERLLNDINQAHQHKLDTLILPCRPETSFISSSAAKEVCLLHGNTEAFVPLEIKALMEDRLCQQIRVGITGSIGAGKSTLVDALQVAGPALGLEVHNIDLDKMAHDVLFSRTEPVYVELRETLQAQFKLTEWSRKSVGNLVFSDDDARKILDAEMEEPLRTRIRADLMGLKGIVLFNGALLVEAGWAKLVNNHFLLITVSPDVQAVRLAKRGLSPDQCQRRIQAQLSAYQKQEIIEEAINRAHFGDCGIINTTNPLHDCVEDCLTKIMQWKEKLTNKPYVPKIN